MPVSVFITRQEEKMKFIRWLFIAALPIFTMPTSAHDYRAGDVRIEHPWTHVAVEGASVAPVYMIIRNGSKQVDALIGGSAPGVAEKVELRGLARGDFNMSVDAVEKISLSAGGQEHLKPHAAHLILVGLKKPLKKGEQFPLTLHFQNAGKVAVKIMVEAVGTDPFHVPGTPAVGSAGKSDTGPK
jgi:periplasmic copper chaperone A